MDYYHIWCDILDGRKDLQFAEAVGAYLGHLRGDGKLEDFSIARRKLGLGPRELGEFHIIIRCRDLAQLDGAFNAAAGRTGEVERLHHAVYSAVKNVQFALYRDFPDPVRTS